MDVGAYGDRRGRRLAVLEETLALAGTLVAGSHAGATAAVIAGPHRAGRHQRATRLRKQAPFGVEHVGMPIFASIDSSTNSAPPTRQEDLSNFSSLPFAQSLKHGVRGDADRVASTSDIKPSKPAGRAKTRPRQSPRVDERIRESRSSTTSMGKPRSRISGDVQTTPPLKKSARSLAAPPVDDADEDGFAESVHRSSELLRHTIQRLRTHPSPHRFVTPPVAVSSTLPLDSGTPLLRSWHQAKQRALLSSSSDSAERSRGDTYRTCTNDHSARTDAAGAGASATTPAAGGAALAPQHPNGNGTPTGPSVVGNAAVTWAVGVASPVSETQHNSSQEYDTPPAGPLVLRPDRDFRRRRVEACDEPGRVLEETESRSGSSSQQQNVQRIAPAAMDNAWWRQRPIARTGALAQRRRDVVKVDDDNAQHHKGISTAPPRSDDDRATADAARGTKPSYVSPTGVSSSPATERAGAAEGKVDERVNSYPSDPPQLRLLLQPAQPQQQQQQQQRPSPRPLPPVSIAGVDIGVFPATSLLPRARDDNDDGWQRNRGSGSAVRAAATGTAAATPGLGGSIVQLQWSSSLSSSLPPPPPLAQEQATPQGASLKASRHAALLVQKLMIRTFFRWRLHTIARRHPRQLPDGSSGCGDGMADAEQAVRSSSPSSSLSAALTMTTPPHAAAASWTTLTPPKNAIDAPASCVPMTAHNPYLGPSSFSTEDSSSTPSPPRVALSRSQLAAHMLSLLGTLSARASEPSSIGRCGCAKS
jgi:hypothetical protein